MTESVTSLNAARQLTMEQVNALKENGQGTIRINISGKIDRVKEYTVTVNDDDTVSVQRHFNDNKKGKALKFFNQISRSYENRNGPVPRWADQIETALNTKINCEKTRNELKENCNELHDRVSTLNLLGKSGKGIVKGMFGQTNLPLIKELQTQQNALIDRVYALSDRIDSTSDEEVVGFDKGALAKIKQDIERLESLIGLSSKSATGFKLFALSAFDREVDYNRAQETLGSRFRHMTEELTKCASNLSELSNDQVEDLNSRIASQNDLSALLLSKCDTIGTGETYLQVANRLLNSKMRNDIHLHSMCEKEGKEFMKAVHKLDAVVRDTKATCEQFKDAFEGANRAEELFVNAIQHKSILNRIYEVEAQVYRGDRKPGFDDYRQNIQAASSGCELPFKKHYYEKQTQVMINSVINDVEMCKTNRLSSVQLQEVRERVDNLEDMLKESNSKKRNKYAGRNRHHPATIENPLHKARKELDEKLDRKIDEINELTDQTKATLSDAIHKAVKRGEIIDTVKEKSALLKDTSKVFDETASKLEKQNKIDSLFFGIPKFFR
ncbi:hypothetical protein L4C34_02990 [Vibrio profundum]|uniref:hypothetical protein n=1 Tax=Vibrio profundum TaxID=2910247 RepID=UPI003D0A0C80